MHLRSIFPVPVVAGMLSFVLVEALGGCASRTSGAGGAADNYAVAVPSLPVVPLHLDRGSDDRGLQELVRAIGDARVVMLGEQWHGDGGAIRVRSELVRILHERLGFDVLVFEADFYSLHRGWDAMRASGDIRAMAEDNVYHFWSLSSASDGLWRYIDAQRFTNRPLSVAGIDPRHLGALARTTLPDELDKRLVADVIGATSEERRRFRVTLEGLLSNEFRRPSPSDQDEFLRELDRLAAALSARDSASRDSFWVQEVRNVRNAALYVWRGASRDRAMGENLAWLATHAYPRKSTSCP